MMTYFRAYRAQQELHSKLKRKPTDEEVVSRSCNSAICQHPSFSSSNRHHEAKVYSAGEKTSEEPTFDKSGDW